MNLCADCAQQAGIEDTENQNANVLSALKLFARHASARQLKSATPGSIDPGLKSVRCQSCGLSGEEFSQTGLLGCPDCYRAFGHTLKKDFQTFHRHMRHRGRGLHPVDSAAFAQTMELAKLRELLERAVHLENYEKAAALRDRIFSLEHGVRTGENQQ